MTGGMRLKWALRLILSERSAAVASCMGEIEEGYMDEARKHRDRSEKLSVIADLISELM